MHNTTLPQVGGGGGGGGRENASFCQAITVFQEF